MTSPLARRANWSSTIRPALRGGTFRSRATVANLRPTAASQTINWPSSPKVMICEPSGVTTACRTTSECPRRVLLPPLWAARHR